VLRHRYLENAKNGQTLGALCLHSATCVVLELWYGEVDMFVHLRQVKGMCEACCHYTRISSGNEYTGMVEYALEAATP
jgi:hypothetical protein